MPEAASVQEIPLQKSLPQETPLQQEAATKGLSESERRELNMLKQQSNKEDSTLIKMFKNS
jgi:hypothetical protein